METVNMSEEYKPNSIDAVLSRIENTLNTHVEETRIYRQANDAKHEVILNRVSSLEGDKKKILGLAIGSGVGAGGLGAALHKLLGGQ